MPQNSLTLVIDENGVFYRVPISCINDPMNYSVNFVDQKLKGKAKPAEKFFNVCSSIHVIFSIGFESTFRKDRRRYNGSFEPALNLRIQA